MSEPWQGPREILRSRLVTLYQQGLLKQAIQALEECQSDIRNIEGDSKERTRVCRVLESLYQLPTLARRSEKR